MTAFFTVFFFAGAAVVLAGATAVAVESLTSPWFIFLKNYCRQYYTRFYHFVKSSLRYFWYHMIMKEQIEFPIPEPVQPGNLPFGSKVEKDSPEFLAMKEGVRRNMEKDDTKINEETLDYLTDLKFVELGLEADDAARKKRIKESA